MPCLMLKFPIDTSLSWGQFTIATIQISQHCRSLLSIAKNSLSPNLLIQIFREMNLVYLTTKSRIKSSQV
ncbi:hypothetical protein Pse7367_3617 [Thalassoporum mexicanum PCC 7367]|nr:hypothetical protein Pse7367_3617 [Pseudanabaena sp. PCC 7367]